MKSQRVRSYEDRRKFRELLSTLKQEAGCADCGNDNPIVLDFDHIRDKKYNVSQMVHDGFSWAAIKKEIEKCEIVCANCHRIRTYMRRMI